MRPHLLLVLALCVIAAPAAESTHEIHPTAKFTLFVPENVDFVRGVICASDYFAGRNIYGDKLGYRELAKELDFVVLKHYLGKAQEMRTRERYDDLIAALGHFAEATGHPELAHAKLVFTGLSFGGRQAFQFAGYDPPRCLAFVAIHGAFTEKHGGILPVEGALAQVPGIFSVAETDGIVRDSPSHQVAAGRKAGAPWAVYVDRGAKHPSVQRQDLNIAWLRAIARARLPEEIPAAAAFQLRDLSREDGWLGRLEHAGSGKKWWVTAVEVAAFAGYPHDRAAAQWLPDEKVAEAWAKRNRQLLREAE